MSILCLPGDGAGHSKEATGASIRPPAMARDGWCNDYRLRDVPKPDAGQEYQEQEAQRDLSEDTSRSRYSAV